MKAYTDKNLYKVNPRAPFSICQKAVFITTMHRPRRRIHRIRIANQVSEDTKTQVLKDIRPAYEDAQIAALESETAKVLETAAAPEPVSKPQSLNDFIQNAVNTTRTTLVPTTTKPSIHVQESDTPRQVRQQNVQLQQQITELRDQNAKLREDIDALRVAVAQLKTETAVTHNEIGKGFFIYGTTLKDITVRDNQRRKDVTIPQTTRLRLHYPPIVVNGSVHLTSYNVNPKTGRLTELLVPLQDENGELCVSYFSELELSVES